MGTLQPIIIDGTIGASGQATETIDIGNRIIEIKLIEVENQTRPSNDPRATWGYSTHGAGTVGVNLFFGYTAKYNDFNKAFPEGFRLGPEDVLKIEVMGDNADVYKIGILYELIKSG